LQNVRLNGKKIFGDQTKNQFIKYKNLRLEKEDRIMILCLVTKLKAVQGVTFIETIIKRINLQKEIFILNIELGLETVIP
jgi:hypothetical protein